MRVTRTVRDFENALMTLLEKQSSDRLTVDQICKEALLHRSSFYRYFNDKYDLLEQALNAQFTQFEDNGESEDDTIKRLILYIDQHKNISRHLAGSGPHSSAHIEMLKILARIMLKRSKQSSDDTMIIALQKSDTPEMMAYAIAGSLVGIFYWWQDNNYDVPTDSVIRFARDRLHLLASAQDNKLVDSNG